MKRKGRDPDEPVEYTLSSGVTVRVLPFPYELRAELDATARERFPDPAAPKVEVETVDGKELVDDLEDEQYKVALAEASRQRNDVFMEALVDLCLEVDMEQYQDKIKRAARYATPPEDEGEKRVWFLKKYALRSIKDVKEITALAMEQIAVGDPEVEKQFEFFRAEMEGRASDEAAPPGAAEE